MDAGGPLTDPSIDLIGRWLEDLSLELERRIPSSADEAGGGAGARAKRELAAKSVRTVAAGVRCANVGESFQYGSKRRR